MADELLILPNEGSSPMTVAEIRDRLVAAGLQCYVEPGKAEVWVGFDGYESGLVFLPETCGTVASAVLQTDWEDIEFVERVFAVFETFGWKYVDGTF